MHHEHPATGLGLRNDKTLQEVVIIVVVYADARLDRDWHVHSIAHCRDAGGDGFRLHHQAGTESAALHTVTGTTDIDIDFIIAALLAHHGCGCHQRRVRSPDLQGHRVFELGKIEQSFGVAMGQCRRSNHFRIQAYTRRYQSQEITTMTVGPVHHGRNGQFVSGVWQCIFSSVSEDACRLLSGRHHGT